MFQALVASGPQPGLGARRFVLSIALHAALIGAALALVPHSPTLTRTEPSEAAILFVAPPRVQTSRPIPKETTRLRSFPPLIQQPSIGVPDLNPLVLPPTLPRVTDLLHNANINPGLESGSRREGDGNGRPELLTAGAVDDPVEVINQPEPRYPATLAQAKLTGRVELTYIVDTLGRIELGSVSSLMSTHREFEAAARASVVASRFRPARLRGRVVRQLVRQRFSFRISE